MKDIRFNFNDNDIDVENGDFAITSTCSQQNAGLMLQKSAVSITQPNFGIGIEDIYANISPNNYIPLAWAGQNQLLKDGALTAKINIESNYIGEVKFDVTEVTYPNDNIYEL